MDDKEDNLNTIILDHTNWDDTSNMNSDIFISDGGLDSTLTISGLSGPYISTGTGWNDTLNVSDSIHPRNTLQIDGEGADILVNGESVMDTLRAIQDRLNILRPNLELEAEWDELRAVGDRYRELEKQFQEKSKMWDTLKKMPPPEIK